VQRIPKGYALRPRLPPSPGYGATSRSNDKSRNLDDSENEMVGWILKKILGSKNQREIRRMAPIVRQINELEKTFQSFSDDELRGLTASWKEDLAKLPTPEEQWRRLDEILPEAFAVVKNAARRLTERGHTFTVCDQPMKWEMVHFDVQLIGGIVLHRGKFSEMATGEG
jgi:preprotein translocase subunit SecA